MTITLATEPMLAHLLASVRIIAWLMLVPPFQGRSVPAPAKVILALGLSFALAPSVVAQGVPTDTVGLVMTTVTQVLIGAGLGFVTQMILGAIAAAGSIVDVFGGFALANGFDPLSMQMNSIFGRFHQLLATMLLFASGGHLLIIGGLLKTFEFLPLGESPDVDGDLPGMLIEIFSTFFMTAIQISLPMVAVLFVADLSLALMTKIAPQMQAMNFMFPVKIGLTLLLVGLSFPVLPEATERLVEMTNQVVSTIVGG